MRGHQVSGLARRPFRQRQLTARARRHRAGMGDFGGPATWSTPYASQPTRCDYRQRRGAAGPAASPWTCEAVGAPSVRRSTDHGLCPVLTSGSAVFGVFNGGDATDTLRRSLSRLLFFPASVFAPRVLWVCTPAGRRFWGGDGRSGRDRTGGPGRRTCAVLWTTGLVTDMGGIPDRSRLFDRPQGGRAGTGERWHTQS